MLVEQFFSVSDGPDELIGCFLQFFAKPHHCGSLAIDNDICEGFDRGHSYSHICGLLLNVSVVSYHVWQACMYDWAS